MGGAEPIEAELVDLAPLTFSEIERSASKAILAALRQDLNAAEIASTEILYQADNEFVQETFIQLFPVDPEQRALAWEGFEQRLAAANLRRSVSQQIWSDAQHVDKAYASREDLPFSVMHSFRTKSVKDAPAQFSIRNYEQKPDIRFTEHGSPFLHSEGGSGMLAAPDLRQKENLDRYEHLLRLMPELSQSEIAVDAALTKGALDAPVPSR